MWLAVGVAAAMAADTPVGLSYGAARLYSTVMRPGWASSVDTPSRRCWTHGTAAELCLAVADRKGRTPQAMLDEHKAGLVVDSCDAPQSSPLGPATSYFQLCHVREGLQSQIRAWHVLADAESVGIGSFKITADDAVASADGDAFLVGLTIRTPEGATTRALPACAALEQVLGASVDRFAGTQGAPLGAGVWESTLGWPGAVGKSQVREKDGRVTWQASLAVGKAEAAAEARAKSFLQELSACDTWCDPMAASQTVNEVSRAEVTYARTTPDALAPRCAGARPRLWIETISAGNANVTFYVDAP